MNENRTAVLLGGGLGKMVCTTSVLPKLKEKYGEIVVVNPYPEVFSYNPHVYRNLTYNEKYLYEDYLQELNVLVGEPYLRKAYRFDHKHLIEAYCDLYGIEYSPDMKPQLFLSPEEEAFGQQQKAQLGDYLILHVTGGTSYYSPQNASNKPVKSRDWPIEVAQRFVDTFVKAFPKIKIIQVALQTEPILKNVQTTNLPSRMLFPLIKYSKTFLSIDGFVNHVSAAVEKKGVVLWGGTDPKRLGYDSNVNMVLDYKCSKKFCHKTDFYSHLGGKEMSCVDKYICMQHDPDEVLAEVSKIIKNSEESSEKACAKCPGK